MSRERDYPPVETPPATDYDTTELELSQRHAEWYVGHPATEPERGTVGSHWVCPLCVAVICRRCGRRDPGAWMGGLGSRCGCYSIVSRRQREATEERELRHSKSMGLREVADWLVAQERRLVSPDELREFARQVYDGEELRSLLSEALNPKASD